jgi:hypothetical protein
MVGHTKISTLRRQPRQKEHYKIGASLGYVEYKACPDYRVKPCLKKKKKKKKKKKNWARKEETEGPRVYVILSYIPSLRPAWAILHHLKKLIMRGCYLRLSRRKTRPPLSKASCILGCTCDQLLLPKLGFWKATPFGLLRSLLFE